MTRLPDSAARRARSILYELFANDGRHGDRRSAALRNVDVNPHPMEFAVVPERDVSVFGNVADRAQTSALLAERQAIRLPVHWEERDALAVANPNLRWVRDGAVYRSASPRSLLYGAAREEQPVRPLAAWSIKTHLSRDAYVRLGGLVGSREISANDALMATVISHVLDGLLPVLSPSLRIQREATAVAARLHGPRGVQEVGAIFRTLADVDVIPGFALYTRSPLSLPNRAGTDAPCLAIAAVEAHRAHHPGSSVIDSVLALFVDPLLDVVFSMAAQGWSAELHPQNFLLELDPETGCTRHVHLRDLHGTNYDRALRLRLGLPDCFALESLLPAFPELTQADLDAWFLRDGVWRARYTAPSMFENTLDHSLALFFFHLIEALYEAKVLDRNEVQALVVGIQDRTEHHARQYAFDLGSLVDPATGRSGGIFAALRRGLHGHILFRRSAR